MNVLNEREKKLLNLLFIILIVSIIWEAIPLILVKKFLGSNNKFFIYPVIASIIFTFFVTLKYKLRLPNLKGFLYFMVVYVLGFGILNLIGYLNFPYYSEVLNGGNIGLSQYGKVNTFFSYLSINLSEKEGIIAYLTLRSFKNLFIGFIFTFGAAYMVYCWYYQSKEALYKSFNKGIFITIGIIVSYSFLLEIPYFMGFHYAKYLLSIVNPLLHSIAHYASWWPPLYWPTQARSIFSEPSFLGTYLAFVIPFIWGYFENKVFSRKKVLISCCLIALTFLVFLSKSRVATGLYLGELFLYSILVCIRMNKRLVLHWLVIVCISIITFGSALVFSNHYMTSQHQHNATSKQATHQAEQYVHKYVLSVADKKFSRNYSRFTVIKKDIEIGKEHLFIGVGQGLDSVYLEKKIPKDQRNKELTTWFKEKDTKGILGITIPVMNMYTRTFSESGIIGSLIFFIPILIVFLKACHIIKLNRFKDSFNNSIVIAACGALASGFNGDFSILCGFWVILGLMFLMIRYNSGISDE